MFKFVDGMSFVKTAVFSAGTLQSKIVISKGGLGKTVLPLTFFLNLNLSLNLRN